MFKVTTRNRMIYGGMTDKYIDIILLNIMLCTNGKISVRINLFLFPILPPSSHSIVVFFFPVGLSSLTQHLQQVIYGVEFSSVTQLLNGTTVGKYVIKIN